MMAKDSQNMHLSGVSGIHLRTTDHGQRTTDHEYPLARPALWRADVIQESRIYAGGNHHASTGHRREHDDFQRDQLITFEARSFSKRGTVGTGVGRADQ